jgi:2,4-dienoyl-CoA reductase (NADPH2)
MFNRLFTPIRVGNIDVVNRIKLPALSTGYAVNEHVSPKLLEFFGQRSQGGVGLMGITVSATKLKDPPFLGIYDDVFLPGLKEVTKACHTRDTKIYAQMGPGYAWCFDGKTVEIVSPSGITATGRPETHLRVGGPPKGSYATRRELSVEEIEIMIQTFAEGARRAREAGFDAVEFVGGSYLIGQFMSSLTNHRTDRYGGDIKGRLRFLLDIIGATKLRAGSDFTITCRLVRQYTGDGITVDDLKNMARLLEEVGIAAIDIVPAWHEDPVPILHSSVRQGKWADLAAQVKQAVHVPIGAGTRISDLSVAETVLCDGKADYIYMARPLIADPQFPMKAKEGRLDCIRPCIACNHCIETIDRPGGIVCTVNPTENLTIK